jgi:hypothetical protein
MAVIKENYLFPIYAPDAPPVYGEQNFHANGLDIVDTLEDADLYVKNIGDSMTGPLTFLIDEKLLSIVPGSAESIICSYNDSWLRLGSSPDDTETEFSEHIEIGREQHTVGTDDLDAQTRISFLATPTINHHATNKQYVDDADETNKELLEAEVEDLNKKIIELEEELNSIAPTLTRGKWTYNPDDSIPGSGEYVLFDQSNSTTAAFGNATKIIISTTDSEGGDHSFSEVALDQYLQILNSDNNAYGLYTVMGSVDSRAATQPHYTITLEYNQSFGDPADAVGVARIKIFTPPLMDPDVYVMKTGDTMSGPLNFGTATDTKGELIVKSERADEEELFRVTALNTAYGGEALYRGLITEDQHIVNKQYVDHAVSNVPGKPGTPGVDAKVNAGNTTTLDAGTAATVTQRGTPGDRIFDFGIPKGTKGDKGDDGPSTCRVGEENEPRLQKGEMYFNKRSNYLIIGIT